MRKHYHFLNGCIVIQELWQAGEDWRDNILIVFQSFSYYPMNRHVHICTTTYCLLAFPRETFLIWRTKEEKHECSNNCAKPQTQFLAFVRLVHFISFTVMTRHSNFTVVFQNILLKFNLFYFYYSCHSTFDNCNTNITNLAHIWWAGLTFCWFHWVILCHQHLSTLSDDSKQKFYWK